jgi:hypothetical protein
MVAISYAERVEAEELEASRPSMPPEYGIQAPNPGVAAARGLRER